MQNLGKSQLWLLRLPSFKTKATSTQTTQGPTGWNGDGQAAQRPQRGDPGDGVSHRPTLTWCRPPWRGAAGGRRDEEGDKEGDEGGHRCRDTPAQRDVLTPQGAPWHKPWQLRSWWRQCPCSNTTSRRGKRRELHLLIHIEGVSTVLGSHKNPAGCWSSIPGDRTRPCLKAGRAEKNK